jgi:hypothetical protein
MERGKDLIRRFRKGDTSPSEAAPVHDPPPRPQYSGPGHVGQMPPRVDSYLRPSPSVEPPRIDRFLMYGSPAPPTSYYGPAPILLQQMPGIPETANATILPLVSTAPGK